MPFKSGSWNSGGELEAAAVAAFGRTPDPPISRSQGALPENKRTVKL